MDQSHTPYAFNVNPLKSLNHYFFLNFLKIPIVESCKYPSITISTKNSDLDLKRQMRKIYANTNLLLRKFSKWSVDVKCYLFKKIRHTVLIYIVHQCGLTALKQL